jgi:hypothetical protein
LAYFHKKQDGFDRAGKIIADIFVALMILTFAIAFFGTMGGLLGFFVLEGALLVVDFLVPNEHDTSGAVVR